MKGIKTILTTTLAFCFLSCKANNPMDMVTAEKILGNPNYKSICYGGYRTCTRDIVPTVAEIKDDLKILAAINIKVLRTYNVHHAEIINLLQAIKELQKEKQNFEMYIMLGAWIDCKNAWTSHPPIHHEESDRNTVEIAEAVRLANKYPEIIKIIAVGNEAMVHWASSYYVTPHIILKWVNYLQDLKKQNKLPKNLWITCSDNFASWGGGDAVYHTKELNELIKAVDYISLHTYPMHDTHYHPIFWGNTEKEKELTKKQQVDVAIKRCVDYAKTQYYSVAKYVHAIDPKKTIHIGETGWATMCNELYGNNGSKATDEYKSATFYQLLHEWTLKENISCFYFEAFDECWKASANPLHSENHFGLFTIHGEAKYVLWKQVDKNVFKGLSRNGKPIVKTYNGNEEFLWKNVELSNKVLNN